jgi:hypothetical protein
MPKPGLPLFCLAWGALMAAPAEAKRGCPEHLREIKRLYAARDPGLLTVNILEPGCTPRELYQAAYYQGFGFYFVERYKDALANLQLARSLTGPWDEQIVQYIWTIQGKLGDADGQAKTLEEFRADFPKSRKLVEMESAERRMIRTRFDGLMTGGFGWQHGDRSYQGARSQALVGGSWSQTRGRHSLSEYVNLSGVASVEDRRHQAALEGGLLYRGRDFSAQADLGPVWTLYRRESDSLLPEREFAWTGSFSHAFRPGNGRTWTAGADLFFLGKTFSSYGLSWEMERREGLKTRSLDLSAELQHLKIEDSTCRSIGQSPERCENERFAAVEAQWEAGRAVGRHDVGAEVRLRWEEGLSSSSWRGLATAGLSHAYRLSPGIKLTNVLDLGGDWWDEDAKTAGELVAVLKASVAWFF